MTDTSTKRFILAYLTIIYPNDYLTTSTFSQTLKHGNWATPCYNGNISEMTVAYNGGSPIKRSFTYDRLSRLTAQTSTDGYNTAYTYNLNSSPRTIMRCGLTSDGSVGTVDDLALAYNGNRLAAVTDYADPVTLESSLDFPSDYAWFGYNADGNLNMDISRDITGISYSPGGMPLAIDIFGDDRFEYNYDALNCKLAENYRGRYPTTSRYYVGSLEFIKEPTDTAPRLVRANLPWGYLDADGRAYAYITDYQGNIRAVVDADGTAIQTTDYYPYGLPMATTTGTAANRYKYGAKEFEARYGLNFHDFEARMLFNDITLFSRPDPKAIDYPGTNPYLYCAANPLRYVDPTGEIIQVHSFEDQELFKQMFNVIDREYITFDNNGYLMQQPLESHTSGCWLYNSIIEINSDALTTTIELSNGFDFADDEGGIDHVEFGEIEKEGSDYEDTDFKTTGVTTGETGNMGKTLFPGKGVSGQNSVDGNVHIHINKQLSKIGALETLGHELFGHEYLYFQTKDRIKASHQYAPGLRDLNTPLVNLIIKARKEIVQHQQ